MRSILPFLAASVTTAVPPVLAQPIPVPSFTSVQLNGGGEVVVRKGPVQRVTLVSGSSDVTRVEVDREHSLEIRACARQCPSNYRLRVVVETPWLTAFAVHGGGTLHVDGNYGPQRDIAAAVHGGGTIDLHATPISQVATAVTGGGTILVGAANTLAVAITGGGTVRYAGNPEVTTAIRGGGNVSRL